MKKLFFPLLASLFVGVVSSINGETEACRHVRENSSSHNNDIPPRFQWDNNSGYCGEVSLISAGLYYGQYMSQYDARRSATHAPQNMGQLLLGINATTAAQKMHLNAIEWNTVAEQNTDQFLAWVKQNVVKGYPVAIGIYMNEYRFYNKKDPNAGDAEYDHIVPVFGISSDHALTDPHYYGDDTLTFSDNGLWGDASNPPYIFSFSFDACQATRKQANARNGAIYSLSNDGSNYGIAIIGIMDLKGETYPVRVDTNVNTEKYEIQDGSDARPEPISLLLTVTVSGLTPGIVYNLYRYNDLSLVPDSDFNVYADQAAKIWKIQIDSGSNYSMTELISSDEIAVYRAVKA